MKYTMNGKEFDNTQDFIEALADWLIDYTDNSDYDEWLNATNGEVISICGIKFLPARILHDLDKIAYESERYNYYNYMISELVDDVESNGKVIRSFGEEKLYLQYEV